VRVRGSDNLIEPLRGPGSFLNVDHRALAGNLARFSRESFPEFVPESFRWTVNMSRPVTKFSIFEKFLVEIGQVFPQALYLE
jgi:hypothetical protein